MFICLLSVEFTQYGLLSDEDVLRHSWLYETYDSDADSLSRDWAAARRIYRSIGRRDLR